MKWVTTYWTYINVYLSKAHIYILSFCKKLGQDFLDMLYFGVLESGSAFSKIVGSRSNRNKLSHIINDLNIFFYSKIMHTGKNIYIFDDFKYSQPCFILFHIMVGSALSSTLESIYKMF